MLWDRVKAHWRKLAVVLAVVLIVPPTMSGLTGTDQLIVSAVAPEKGDTMTVSIAAKQNLLSKCSGSATVEVLKGEIIVFSEIFGDVPMDGCRGSIDIPYDKFADRNGQYTVRVNYDGIVSEERVQVNKVVNWVLVRAFPDDENQRTRIDVAFDAIKGQPLSSGIFSSGTLILEIRWETCEQDPIDRLLSGGEECTAHRNVVWSAEIPIEDEASTHVFVPWESLAGEDEDEPHEGYYNVTATYHNEEAKANFNVPMDPTVYREDPPGNWFEVDYP